MRTKVICIAPEYETILGFLFPTYTITDSVAVTSKFITHRTVKSKMEREALEYQFDDAIFISTQIFDELWDEEFIKEQCVKFARENFKSRKKTFSTMKETFVQDCVDFIFGVPPVLDDQDINELFDAVGSNLFPVKFFNLAEKIPLPKVIAALTTFLCKITKESTSVYYRKKALALEDKIIKNTTTAIENRRNSTRDDLGLAECKLVMDLFV